MCTTFQAKISVCVCVFVWESGKRLDIKQLKNHVSLPELEHIHCFRQLTEENFDQYYIGGHAVCSECAHVVYVCLQAWVCASKNYVCVFLWVQCCFVVAQNVLWCILSLLSQLSCPGFACCDQNKEFGAHILYVVCKLHVVCWFRR